MKKIFIVMLFAILALAPALALADALGGGLLKESVGGVGLESDVTTSIANLIETALALTGTIFLVLTVAGGIMWMTAAGNDEKIGKAKKIILGAAIGLAVIVFAYTITFFVTSRVGGAAAGGGNTTPQKTCAEVNGTCQSSCPSADLPGTCPDSSTPHCCGGL